MKSIKKHASTKTPKAVDAGDPHWQDAYARSPHHLGLQTQRNAVIRSRLPDGAAVVLVGASGVGKSSTASNLVAKQIFESGDVRSVTRKASEVMFRVDLPDVWLENTFCSLVDSPGTPGDTGGLEQEARNLETLGEFWSKVLERSNAPRGTKPNCLLVVARASDPRLDGPMSSLSRNLAAMCKLDLVDMNQPNVVLVLTCLMQMYRNEDEGGFKRVVDGLKRKVKQAAFNTLGFDPPVVVLENFVSNNLSLSEHDRPYSLPVVEDWVKLPHGELQPLNLYNTMSGLMVNNQDTLGCNALRAVFMSTGKHKMRKGISQPPAGGKLSPVAQELFQFLSGEDGSNLDTDMVRTLSDAFGPPAGLNMGRRLHNAGFESVSSLRGQTVPRVLAALSPYSPPPDYVDKLTELFELCLARVHADTLLIGQGFSIATDEPTPGRPVKFSGQFRACSLNMNLPEEVIARAESSTSIQHETFASHKEMIQRKLSAYGVSGSVSAAKVMANVSASGGVVSGSDVSSASGEMQKTFVFEQRILSLQVDETTLVASPEFVKAVKSLPSFTEEAEDRYRELFVRFGSHIVTRAHLGGQISGRVSVNAKYASHLDALDVHGEVSAKIGLLFGGANGGVNVGQARGSVASTKNACSLQSLQCRGGNAQYHPRNFDTIDPRTGDKWVESLADNPVVLRQSMSLVPIHRLVQDQYPTIAENLRIAQRALYGFDKPPAVPEAAPTLIKKRSDVPPLPPPPKKEGSCLLGSTVISMADGTLRPVSLLRPGDIIMGANNLPRPVLAVGRSFLGSRQLYSFEGDGVDGWFTPEHQFVQLSSDGSFVRLCVSKEALYAENPLMREENVEEFGSAPRELPLLGPPGDSPSVVSAPCRVVHSHHMLAPETPVFFIEVVGGMYWANKHLTHHELPDFAKWPLTFALLASVLGDTAMRVCEMVPSFSSLVDRAAVERLARHIVEQWKLHGSDASTNTLSTLPALNPNLADVALNSLIERVLTNPVVAWYGLQLYAQAGEWLRETLNPAGTPLPPEEVARTMSHLRATAKHALRALSA